MAFTLDGLVLLSAATEVGGTTDFFAFDNATKARESIAAAKMAAKVAVRISLNL